MVAAHEVNAGRSAAIGAAVGFAAVTVGVTAIGILGGIDPRSALGIGAVVGTWGGTGFGFMLGGTIPLARELEGHTDRSSHHRQGDSNDPAAR